MFMLFDANSIEDAPYNKDGFIESNYTGLVPDDPYNYPYYDYTILGCLDAPDWIANGCTILLDQPAAQVVYRETGEILYRGGEY